MMVKVRVNKEVFEALEYTKLWEVEETQRIELIMNYYSTKKFKGKTKVINELGLYLFLDILRFGYELELSPHQMIKLEFEEKYKNESLFNEGFYKGMLFVLKTLDEKVEGVNE